MAKNVIAGSVLLGLALVYWLAADAIPRSVLGGSVGAAGLPQLLAVALGLLSLILILQAILAGRPARTAPAAEPGTETPSAREHWRALGMLAIGIAYLLLVEHVGYWIGIALLLLAVPLYTGRRLSWSLVGFALGGALLFYVIFVRLLAVPMPPGPWPALFG